MQKKRPMTKNPHPIFKPKYNIHELSDDIRICDFTCQPDLIIAKKNKTAQHLLAVKNPTHPKHIISMQRNWVKLAILLPFFIWTEIVKELIFLTFFWLVEHQKIFWACIKTETQQFRLVAELRFEYPEAKHHLETGDTYFKRESVPLGRCPCPFVPRLVGSGFKPALLLEVATGRIDSIPAATLRSNRAPYVMLRLRIYLLF